MSPHLHTFVVLMVCEVYTNLPILGNSIFFLHIRLGGCFVDFSANLSVIILDTLSSLFLFQLLVH